MLGRQHHRGGAGGDLDVGPAHIRELHGLAAVGFRGNGLGCDCHAEDGSGARELYAAAIAIDPDRAELRAGQRDGSVDDELHHLFEIEFCGDAGGGAVQCFKQALLRDEFRRHRVEFADVGADSEPGRDRALPVTHRPGTREKGTEDAVAAAQLDRHLERLAGLQRVSPALADGSNMLLGMTGTPFAGQHLFGRGASVVIPAIVEPDGRAVGIVEPGHLREMVRHGGQAGHRFA